LGRLHDWFRFSLFSDVQYARSIITPEELGYVWVQWAG
jgi:hypothetical protein